MARFRHQPPRRDAPKASSLPLGFFTDLLVVLTLPPRRADRVLRSCSNSNTNGGCKSRTPTTVTQAAHSYSCRLLRCATPSSAWASGQSVHVLEQRHLIRHGAAACPAQASTCWVQTTREPGWHSPKEKTTASFGKHAVMRQTDP